MKFRNKIFPTCQSARGAAPQTDRQQSRWPVSQPAIQPTGQSEVNLNSCSFGSDAWAFLPVDHVDNMRLSEEAAAPAGKEVTGSWIG